MQGSVGGGRERRGSVCCSYAVRMIRKPDLGRGVSEVRSAWNVLTAEDPSPGASSAVYMNPAIGALLLPYCGYCIVSW